jgi:hypothetical protein
MRRLLRLTRAVYGVALLIAPSQVLHAYGGDPADGTSLAAARILGGRHLVQAALIGPHPGPVRRTSGVMVDFLHAASMYAVARVDAPRRRPALIDGSIAAGFAVLGAGAR